MADETHFEIFLKKNRKAGWVLMEALRDREEAIAKAQILIAQHPKASARVSKEKFDDATRTFRAYTVFEAGGEKYEDDGRADKKVDLPCSGPSDLITAHARAAITRALSGWLTRQTCVSLELLHRIDLVERLEATGSEMQHAVQKIAIASASQSAASVQHFVKQINGLVSMSVKALYADDRAGVFTKLPDGGIAEFARQHAGASDRERRLRAAIALRLKGATSWPEKFDRCLTLIEEAGPQRATAPWAFNVAAEFLTELTAVDAVALHLVETRDDLGDEVDGLTDAIGGRGRDSGAKASAPGLRLAKAFADYGLPDARVVLARRILSALLSPKRLKPTDIHRELELNRGLAERLVASCGGLIGHAEIAEAFIARSGRLLQQDALDAYLADATSPVDAVMLLAKFEDNLVGDHNKRKLASILRAHLGAHAVERQVVKGDAPATTRMAELAAVSRVVTESDLSPTDKREIGALVDRLAMDCLAETQLFEKIEQRGLTPLACALALLKLAAMGGLPSGAACTEAASRAVKLVRSPQGRDAAADPANATLMSEIARLVEALSADQRHAA